MPTNSTIVSMAQQIDIASSLITLHMEGHTLPILDGSHPWHKCAFIPLLLSAICTKNEMLIFQTPEMLWYYTRQVSGEIVHALHYMGPENALTTTQHQQVQWKQLSSAVPRNKEAVGKDSWIFVPKHPMQHPTELLTPNVLSGELSEGLVVEHWKLSKLKQTLPWCMQSWYNMCEWIL